MSESDAIDLQCPQCQQRLRVPSAEGGKQIRCPDCNAMIDVPTSSGITPEEPRPWSKPAEPPTDAPDEAPRRSRYDDEDDIAQEVRRHKSAGGARVHAPAISMLAVAVLGLGLATYNSVVALVGEPLPVDPNAPPFIQEILRGAHGPTAALMQACFGMMSLATIVGSVQLLRRKWWGFGIAVSVLSMVNFASCCCILGLPFGIWTLVTLTSPDVKEAFS
jgi:hypothetical protein